ncbi:MAG: VWA domain-containing protein, partial [Kiritimatiellaeota bacterium]|nr:VWA domain-containing protein [Kiritimatiellota bacterium]
ELFSLQSAISTGVNVVAVLAGAAIAALVARLGGFSTSDPAAYRVLLVLMLAGPVLHHRHTLGELARIMVFVDASKSMSVNDDFMELPRKLGLARAYGWLSASDAPTNRPPLELLSNATVRAAVDRFDGHSRWQRVESLLLDQKDGLLPRLVNKHNVELWSLADGEAQRLWLAEQSLPLPTALPGKPEGQATDLGTAINARVAQKQDARCAVVLVSDGQHNSGGSPIEVAKIAGGRNIPFFTIGVGAAERPGDLAVLGVTGPETVFFEDRIKGEILLKDDMPPGQPFTVRIEEGGKTLWEQTLVTERNHRRTVEYDFPVKELVEARKTDAQGFEHISLPLTMRVVVPALEGEKDKANNETVLRTRAVTQRRKLLLLEGRPRWEFRYLRNTFERDPQWEVNALVAGTEVNDLWPRGTGPGKLPADREALFAYDLIVFGEVPQKMLNDHDLELLTEFVGTRGGGLVFVDGQREVLRGYAKTALGPLFPVEWLAGNSKEQPASLQLTERGTTFAPLRLAADAHVNAALWRGLPPPHWVAATHALPGSETLLDAVLGQQKLPALVLRQFGAGNVLGQQKLPALVLRQFGAGKVLYLGLDEAWRWRFNVADKYHEPFWHQVANAIMEPPYAVLDKQAALDAGATNYREGDSAQIRARLRDVLGRAITEGHPQALLYRDGQKLAAIPLAADEKNSGTFRGKTPPLTPGRYEIRLDPQGLISTQVELSEDIFVQGRGGDATREMGDLNCNEELLQQMARASNGAYVREENAAQLLEKLEPLSKGRIEESETVLWQSWWWFGAIVILLTVEWLLRKRAGLI